MASVRTVYETLKDVVNKDQQGFISPSTFNRFASVAQLRIYNRLFTSLKDAQRNLKAGFDRGRDKGIVKRIEEDLATFAKSSLLTKSSGVFSRPDDFSRLISISTNGDIMLGQSSRTPIELCYDEEKIERMLISNISAPSEKFPVALISGNIEVFPESINKIRVRYYKIPEGVTQGGEKTSNQPTFVYTAEDTFDSTNSIDFELPEHYVDDLVYEIAELAGVNLRDQFVAQYAQGEQAQVKTEQSF